MPVREHGLNQLRQNTSYSGGETLSLGNDSCEVIAVWDREEAIEHFKQKESLEMPFFE